MSTSFQKLPSSMRPIVYNIEFVPNPHTFKFNGSQTIECEINERVDLLQLNVKDMEVFEAKCNGIAAQITYDEPNEIVNLKFPSPLEMGPALLTMNFCGNHNDLMKGFYRSSYVTPSGETKTNLTTQFEASDARRAFPCIDEPDRKARFAISMVVPNNKIALSNMPEIERKAVEKPAGFPDLPGVHYELVKFDKTPIMSTYILAMVVGDFEHIEDKDSNGVLIRVFAPVGKKHCCDYAMHVAKKALPFYSECFGVEYPLPKLDLIAIPDFAAGAMENWGLVTYRETALLIDPEQSPVSMKQRVALVVAHELAHMWFGNLVTMKWWTHLWLNEGFATWMEYLCVDKVVPEFDIWTTFTTSELSTAFSLDGLKSSHPIEVEVGPPSEVDEIFDSISYAKGASVINMLYNWIGHESFFLGLKAYIAKYQYSNTQTEDLWDALGQASGKNVREVMSEWTRKMGYPIVGVSKDADSSSLVLTQKRFLSDGSKDTENYNWPIPLTVAHPQKAKITHLMNPADAATNKIAVPAEIMDELLVNPGRSSFVRLQYSSEFMPGIKRMLQAKVLGPRDRLAILDDYISLSFAGHIPIMDIIDLMQAYSGESHHIVWDSLIYGISHIRLLVEEAGADHNIPQETIIKALNGLNRLCVILAEPVFKQVGWEAIPNEDHNSTLLRSNIISVLGRSGYEPVITEARKRFDSHVGSVSKGDQNIESTQIKADIRTAIYSTCMRHGGQETYDALHKLYEMSKMSDERVRLLHCMGLPADANLRQKTLQFGLSDAVRKQDRYCCFISLTGSGPQGRRDYWNFLQQNIDAMPEVLGSQALLAHVCKHSCRGFAKEERLNEVRAFWEAHPVPCQRAVKQAIEEIGINASQLARDGESLLAKLCTV